jgi:hypothetical protein
MTHCLITPFEPLNGKEKEEKEQEGKTRKNEETPTCQNQGHKRKYKNYHQQWYYEH